MRADEGKHPCQEAEVYYYDLLYPDEGAVPEVVRRHVAGCPACQEQMRRLREALFEEQRGPGLSRSWDEETIEALAQQFQLLDQQVTCSDVKPFLPTLARALPQIRIPTPVTVHVDHCLPCAEDLAAIQELDLTTDQLQRLSQFFESHRGGAQPGERDASAAWQERVLSPREPRSLSQSRTPGSPATTFRRPISSIRRFQSLRRRTRGTGSSPPTFGLAPRAGKRCRRCNAGLGQFWSVRTPR